MKKTTDAAVVEAPELSALRAEVDAARAESEQLRAEVERRTAPPEIRPAVMPRLALDNLKLLDRRSMSVDQMVRLGKLPGELNIAIGLVAEHAGAFDAELDALQEERALKPLREAREAFLQTEAYDRLRLTREKLAETEAELLQAEQDAETALQEAAAAVSAHADPASHEETADASVRKQGILRRRLETLRPLLDERKNAALRELRRHVYTRRRELYLAARGIQMDAHDALLAAVSPLVLKALLADRLVRLLLPHPTQDMLAGEFLDLPADPQPRRTSPLRTWRDATPGATRVFRVELPEITREGKHIRYLELTIRDHSGGIYKQRHLNVEADCEEAAWQRFRVYAGISETRATPKVTELRPGPVPPSIDLPLSRDLPALPPERPTEGLVLPSDLPPAATSLVRLDPLGGSRPCPVADGHTVAYTD